MRPLQEHAREKQGQHALRAGACCEAPGTQAAVQGGQAIAGVLPGGAQQRNLNPAGRSHDMLCWHSASTDQGQHSQFLAHPWLQVASVGRPTCRGCTQLVGRLWLTPQALLQSQTKHGHGVVRSLLAKGARVAGVQMSIVSLQCNTLGGQGAELHSYVVQNALETRVAFTCSVLPPACWCFTGIPPCEDTSSSIIRS